MDKMESIGDYEYSVNEMLGYGSFAVVFKGRSSKNKDFPVAIKKISKKKLPNPDLIAKEVKIMKELTALRHENVVHLYDCKESANSVYLTMEFCSGGDLSDYLNEKGTLSEDTIRLFLRQILSAIEAIHSHGIIHRDLKPQNLLLSHKEERYPPPARIAIKIADFGFARFLQDGVMAATLCGTPLYMAPEVIMGNQHDGKADLWSLGTIVYQCLIGQPPFQAKSPPDLKAFYERSANLLPKIPEGTSAELKDLLKMLLKRDPKERLSFQAFQTHAFLMKTFAARPKATLDSKCSKQDSNVAGASSVPATTTSASGLLSTTVNAISRLATTATMVTMAAKTSSAKMTAEPASKSVPKQFQRSSPSSTSPSPYSKLMPAINLDIERNLANGTTNPNSNSTQSNFSLDDDFVVVPRQIPMEIDNDSSIGEAKLSQTLTARENLSPPSRDPIAVPTYRETFEKHLRTHTKIVQPVASIRKTSAAPLPPPPRKLAEIIAAVVSTATSQHDIDGAFAPTVSTAQPAAASPDTDTNTADKRVEDDGMYDYEPLIETIRPPTIEYGLANTSPTIGNRRRHRSISLNFGDGPDLAPQSPQWTSSFGFGCASNRMKYVSAAAAAAGTSAPKLSLEPFDELSADESDDTANGNGTAAAGTGTVAGHTSNDNFSDLGAISGQSRSSLDRDSAYANLSAVSIPKFGGSYKNGGGAHFVVDHHVVDTFGSFFRKSSSQTSLTYIPPELCEDVLFNKEHNVNLAKLHYMHALCECIRTLAKEKTDEFARTLADNSDDEETGDEMTENGSYVNETDSASSSGGGGDANDEDMGYNDEICDCSGQCTCDRINSMENFYVNRCEAEQVILNKKLIKLLSATVRFAWSQIQTGNLKQSTNVMKVVNSLQKMLNETLGTFRKYSDKMLKVTALLDEDSWKMMMADNLIYKHAIEMCRAAAIHEFRANFADAFKCYRIAQLILHYLPYSSLGGGDDRVRFANYMNLLQVRLGVLQEKGVIYVVKKNEIDTDNY